MKNILLVTIMFVVSGCGNDYGTCPSGATTSPPCSIFPNPSTGVDIYHNDYCQYLSGISEYSTGCYFAYDSTKTKLRKEATEYADKMALLRKQDEAPVTCIVEKSE